jgi:hypothetical protein
MIACKPLYAKRRGDAIVFGSSPVEPIDDALLTQPPTAPDMNDIVRQARRNVTRTVGRARMKEKYMNAEINRQIQELNVGDIVPQIQHRDNLSNYIASPYATKLQQAVMTVQNRQTNGSGLTRGRRLDEF